MGGIIQLDQNIDLVGVAVAVYEASTPSLYGHLQNWQEPLTRQQVIGQIYGEQPYLLGIDDNKGTLQMDYVRGRRCKCWVNNWWFGGPEYDQVHGEGAAERLIANVGRRRRRTEVILTGCSLEDAQSKIHETVPTECLYYVGIIEKGEPQVVEGLSFDNSVYEAIKAAKAYIPGGAEILKQEAEEYISEERELVSAWSKAKAQKKRCLSSEGMSSY